MIVGCAMAACQSPPVDDDLEAPAPETAGGSVESSEHSDATIDEAALAQTSPDAARVGAIDGSTPSLGPHIYAVFEQNFTAPETG